MTAAEEVSTTGSRAGGVGPGVVVADLSKDFGDGPVVDGVTFEAPRGAQTALVGPNGSGKTTLLAVAAGLLEPTGGRVTVMGATAGSIEARAVTSFVPDNPVLYDDLSVMEHLEYVARLHGVRQWRPRAQELVERLGLAARADDLPSRFSRGLRQKTAIAVALARPFGALLIDEPFVGLDQMGRKALMEFLAEASADGASVLVATHQRDYLSVAQRCVGMLDGTVAFSGRPDDAAVSDLLD